MDDAGTFTFGLYCSNAVSGINASDGVVVDPPPPPPDVIINSFVASPSTILTGETTTLSWNVSNADRCYPELGPDNWLAIEMSLPTGQTTVTLEGAGTVAFVMYCYNTVSGVSARADVSINPPEAAIINSFDASPSTITAGESTTLAWSVSNADSCTASGGAGGWAGSSIGLPSGSQQVSLDEAGGHTFTLSCSNQSGSDNADALVTVEALPAPDLGMQRVSAALREVSPGQSFAVAATIANEGDQVADASNVRFYLSRDAFIDYRDTELGRASLVSLNAGQEQEVTAEIPASVAPGQYYLGACADVVPGETDTDDNCREGPVIMVDGGGDGCEGTAVSCDQGLSSSLASSSCTGGPAGSSHYAELFFHSAEPGDLLLIEADWNFDGYLLLENPNGLVVAENDNHTSSANSRIEHEATQSGDYRIWATSYTPATTGVFDLSLNCGSPGGPDLQPDTPGVSSSAPGPGQVITVDARLWNIGDQPADSTTLRYLLSSDSSITTSDAEMGTDGAPALSAGASVAVDIDLSAPGTPGPYWIGVCADAVSGEAVTANNCSAGRRINVAEAVSCTINSLGCGTEDSSSLNTADCTGSPRGAGYYAEAYDFQAQAGIPLKFSVQWADLDGYLYLVDSSGRVVAQNDDYQNSGPGQSLIEYTPASAGNYRLWATTFARNEEGSYGLTALCGAASAPDLAASTVTVDDSTVKISQTLGVSARVVNVGEQGAPATTAYFVLSNDPQITTTDRTLASVDVAALSAGASADLNTLVTAPERAGSYWVGLCVDVVSGESITTNNCSQLNDIPGQVLQSASTGKSRPQAEGDNGTLVEVTSGSACNASVLSCGQSTNGTLAQGDCDTGPRGPGYRTDPYTLNGNAGDTVSLGTQWTGMDGILYLESPAGDIYSQNDDFQDKSRSLIEVELDSNGSYTVWPTAFDQGDTTGNYTLSLECNNPAAPDLASDTPGLGATTVRPGQSLAINTTVRNNGRSTAEATRLRYYLSTTTAVTETDRLLGAGDIPELAQGGSEAETLTVPLNVLPGNYYVVTCVDPDPLELDLANNCASNGPVTIEQDDKPIPINTGLNDAWFNPITNGQGFFINVFPDTRLMFLSWFTFDTERPPANVTANLGDTGQRWLTAQGNYELGVATLDVTLSEGGTLDSPTPIVISTPGYGTMRVSFSDCNTGEIVYDLPSEGESGAIPITRVVDDNVRECENQIGALEQEPPSGDFGYSPLLNDAWFNPETNGQGFFFNVFPEIEAVFLSWFTYDTERPPTGTPYNLGEPGHRWLTAQGPFNGDTASLSVTQTTGGVFNQATPQPQNSADGSITATFSNCNEGVVHYDIASIGESGSVPIQRVTRDSVPACDQSAKGPGEDDPQSIKPNDKTVLENECGKGSVNWVFDWPDDPDAGTYVFWLSRSDSQASGEESPYLPRLVSESRAVYSKETPIQDEHLQGWEWVYGPYGVAGKHFGRKGGRYDGYEQAIEGRPRHGFSVQPQSECLD
jgi:hypothetical protein